MQSFTYDTLPSRVVFGWDALARLPEEIDRYTHPGSRDAAAPCRS